MLTAQYVRRESRARKTSHFQIAQSFVEFKGLKSSTVVIRKITVEDLPLCPHLACCFGRFARLYRRRNRCCGQIVETCYGEG